MYLSVLLILVAIFVFYNEILCNYKNLNRSELCLLAISFIAIVVAAVNYMKINTITENFTSGRNDVVQMRRIKDKSTNSNHSNHYSDTLVKVMNDELKKQARNHNKDVNDVNDVNEEIELHSSKSDEYLDSNPDYLGESYEKIDSGSFNKLNSFQNVQPDAQSVSKINTLLTSGNKFKKPEKFSNSGFGTGIGNKDMENVNSLFAPQIIIGNKSSQNTSTKTNVKNEPKRRTTVSGNKGNGSNNWETDDGMTFKNTMKPTSNLWRDENGYLDDEVLEHGNNWSQSLSAYGQGKWTTNLYIKPSDWVNLPQGSPTTYDNETLNKPQSNKSTFVNTPRPTTRIQSGNNAPSVNQKMCAAYDDLNVATDKSGNLLIGNYTKAKKFVPGYTYVPPVYWDVPQRHTPVCAPPELNVRKLTGLMDTGAPINALELNQDGSLAQTEDTVQLTNVGSIMPKFNYTETPYSQPYYA